MFSHAGARMIADTLEKVIRFMDRSNVRLAVFASHRTLMDGFCPDFDLKTYQKYPDKFRLYYPVLSLCLDPEHDLRTVSENPAYIGFKFLCDYYKTPLENPRHTPYFEYANSRKMPVLCHTWGGSPYDGVENVSRVLEKYRDLSLIAGHSFRGDEDMGVIAAKKYDNLYFEMTAVLSAENRLEKFIKAGFSKRIVFGVDAPWFSYDNYIGALLSADISDDDRRDILFRNAAAVLEKGGVEIYNCPRNFDKENTKDRLSY
jgi:predicted TIM-barrel fold metal-dependent hydrolase